MANEQEFGLLLQAQLNVGLSLKTINEQIQALSKHPSLQKLKIQIEVDEKFVQSINKFIASADKLKKVSDEQNKVMQETIQEFRNLDGSIQKTTEQVLKNGEVIKKSRTIHDENKKSMQDESVAAQKLAQNVDKLNKAELDSITINKNKAGVPTGINVVSSQGYTVTRQRLEADGQTLINSSETANYKKQRENDLKEEQQLLKEAEAIDRAHYQALTEDQKRFEATDKIHYLALQKNRDLDLKNQQSAIKEAEALDRAHYMAIQDNNKRIEAMDKLHYLALEKNKKYDATSDVQLAKLGTSVGQVSNTNMNAKELKAYVQTLAGANAEFVRSKKVVDEFNGIMQQVEYRVKEGGKSWHNFTANISDASGNVRVFDKGITDVSNRQLGVAQKFKVMAQSIPLWYVGMTGFIQSLRFFSEGIKYVDDFNATLTQIGTAVNYNIEKQQELAKSFQNLGRELKASTSDVSSAALEFYRQGLNDEQVVKRLKTTTEYSRISGLAFVQSADLLTAASNSMNVDINRVADVFTLLGRQNCPLAS